MHLKNVTPSGDLMQSYQLYLYLFMSQKYLFLDLIPEVVVYGQNYIIYSLCVKLFSIAIYTMYKFSSLGHIALF